MREAIEYLGKTKDYPFLIFAFTFLGLWLAARIGAFLPGRQQQQEREIRADFGEVLAATLTLLALIIGFIFLMATNRYDQRKNYEAEEANAIGTAYVRADLLPAADAAKVRALLAEYLDQRISFYVTDDEQELRQIGARVAQLQSELWTAVATPAAAQPTPVAALAVSSMNEVLNLQAHTRAASWNRIPLAAWVLVTVIAIFCNALVGYGARKVKSEGGLLLILPVIVSTAFFLIADIDSPRSGLIHVWPRNLESLAISLPGGPARAGESTKAIRR